jgi:hypothetical protein
VNGFGFDAETWDQKQVEAASLVEKLRTLTDASSQQVALMASKLGLWDNGLTNPQLGQLLNQTRRVLNGADISANRRDQILEPIVKRITLNYEMAAYQFVVRAFLRKAQSLQTQRSALISTGKPDEVANLNKEIEGVEREQTRLHKELPNDGPNNIATVPALVGFVKGVSLGKDEELLKQLTEIDTDVRFFDDNKTLRREIDWSFAFQ